MVSSLCVHFLLFIFVFVFFLLSLFFFGGGGGWHYRLKRLNWAPVEETAEAC